MNPFVYIFDDHLHEQGNPDLKPSLSDNVEASFVMKNKFKASLFIVQVTNPISKSFHFVNNDRILVLPDNLSSSNTYGLRVNTAILKPISAWKINANLSLNYKKYKWKYFDESEKVSVFTPVIGLNNQFDFANSWSAELNLTYRGKTADGQYTFKPLFISYAGLRKQILKGNATIAFTIDDILQSNLLKGKVRMPGQNYKTHERESGRLFHLSVTYRFKQGQEAKEAKRKRGIDEKDRI